MPSLILGSRKQFWNKIENIEEDLMREIRYLDKLVDELAKGKKLSSILRQ